MNCVLFAKIDKVFSWKIQNIEKILEMSGNFVSPEKWEPWFSAVTRICYCLWSRLTVNTAWVARLIYMTRMHSSRICTVHSSSCLLWGGGCLSACWDTHPRAWAWRPPRPWPGNPPPGLGLDTSPSQTPQHLPGYGPGDPLARPPTSVLGMGWETPPARPPNLPLEIGQTPQPPSLGMGLETLPVDRQTRVKT